jgi:hypothetical protein
MLFVVSMFVRCNMLCGQRLLSGFKMNKGVVEFILSQCILIASALGIYIRVARHMN